MRFTTTLAAAFAVTLGLSGMFMAAPASAAGEEVHAPEVDFSFDGPFGTYDMIQLQRGFQVYRDVCSGCHSMSLLSYRNLGQLGFTEEEVRAIASNYTVTDGPKEWKVRARLCDPVKSTSDCMTLRRVTLTSTEDGMMAHQPRHQGSGNIESLASAHGLTLLQPGQSGEVGEWIDVLVL